MSKYVDIPSIIQVIGTVYQMPSLLDETDKYVFYDEDFTEEFHRILFGTIYNLHMLGVKRININSIEDYLSARPEKYAIYQSNKGAEYLQKLVTNTTPEAFDYYYSRMKKMTLFRSYQKIGFDLSWLYDNDNIFDVKKKQAQEDWLDNTPIEEIADLIDKKIYEIRSKYADNARNDLESAGTGVSELLERFKEVPDVGYPLYGALINTVCRGARLKKLYLRSAATNVGKTRAMIADACTIACNELYNPNTEKWEKNGTKEPVLFISTEQEKDEIQTMMVAFISNVDEEKIINGEYEFDEWDRVCHAADILSQTSLYIQELPDFSMQDVENSIKYGIKEYNIKYVMFDYLHTSMKILSEISSKSGVKSLREDNILFMIAVKLKDICNQYGVFIMTSTQLNSSYTTASHYDQNLLRGAKSIADKCDYACVMLETTPDDIAALEPVLKKGGLPQPKIKIAIYKNRRGRYKDILLWATADRGVCKINPMFATDYNYELIALDNLKINVEENDNGN